MEVWTSIHPTIWNSWAFWEVSYHLTLSPQLSHVHNVFHVSLLRRHNYHPLHVASYSFDLIQPGMFLLEETEAILDRQDRVMRNQVSFLCIIWYVSVSLHFNFANEIFFLEGKSCKTINSKYLILRLIWNFPKL